MMAASMRVSGWPRLAWKGCGCVCVRSSAMGMAVSAGRGPKLACRGALSRPDGSRYDGQFRHNKAHGSGRPEVREEELK